MGKMSESKRSPISDAQGLSFYRAA